MITPAHAHTAGDGPTGRAVLPRPSGDDAVSFCATRHVLRLCNFGPFCPRPRLAAIAVFAGWQPRLADSPALPYAKPALEVAKQNPDRVGNKLGVGIIKKIRSWVGR